MHIIAENLGCERLSLPVFANVNFRLEPGAALVVRGANGSGKSSLLRLMAGLLSPASGSCRAFVDAMCLEGLRLGQAAHYCGHLDGLKVSLTIGESLHFFHALSVWQDNASSIRDDSRNSIHALTHFGLARLGPDYPVRFLSAGQRRRLSLCRLLSQFRPLWLLDEPVVSLDEEGRAKLREIINTHRQEGGIVVLTHHTDDFVETTQTLDMNDFRLTQKPMRENKA